MTNEPELMLALVAGSVVVMALGFAAIALRSQRRLRARLAACEQSIAQVEQAIQSSAALFADTEARLTATRERMDQLVMRQGAIDATGHKAAFQQAIALMRRGASAAELVSVCGVSQGEARLIETMYGGQSIGAAEVRAN